MWCPKTTHTPTICDQYLVRDSVMWGAITEYWVGGGGGCTQRVGVNIPAGYTRQHAGHGILTD